MSEEIPVRGPEPREVLDNRDVPSDLGDRPIQVRVFDGDRLLSENSLGEPQKGRQFSNALENAPEVEEEPTALAGPSSRPDEERAIPVFLGPKPPVVKAPPLVEVTFIGAFGEITAPFSSVVRQSGVVVLTQAKGQSFKFTPKRTDEGETLTLVLNTGDELQVANPGIAYDRACPCCGVKERAIVLLEVSNN